MRTCHRACDPNIHNTYRSAVALVGCLSYTHSIATCFLYYSLFLSYIAILCSFLHISHIFQHLILNQGCVCSLETIFLLGTDNLTQ
ncbi:hypothetical protein F5X96DRAFT_623550 [Biscogniauxia mediterranea]|nr:hypothetical protein F5X96DRAFT_623550 [Biscogniauxia mediterranea]